MCVSHKHLFMCVCMYGGREHEGDNDKANVAKCEQLVNVSSLYFFVFFVQLFCTFKIISKRKKSLKNQSPQ